MLYRFYNGMFLYQLQPAFIYNRQDALTWLFMQTGLHQWLLNNRAGCMLFDVLFCTAPAVYWLHYCFAPRTSLITATCMVLFNWVYVQCYTLYPSNSIEGHIAWLMFPLVFLSRKEKTFELLFNGLRYFFLYFFASAGLWKLRQHGVFNYGQMSGILLYQHSQMLTNSPGYWQSRFILWLIQHQLVGYLLYVLATVMELAFIAGFFTKRFDKLLAALFITFLLADFIVMRIPYFEALPLLLTLIPGMKQGNNET